MKAIKTGLKEILALRNLFLWENNFQIRYNACHERGWTDSYMLTVDDTKIGYGSIKGNKKVTDRDTVFEFYVIPPFRDNSTRVFSELLASSHAIYIECQSNDALLASMLYQYSGNINSNVMLFADNITTQHNVAEVIFRHRSNEDNIFEHKGEPVGDYVLELNGEVVATGGFLLHYNMPFADLYMEVKEEYRKKGLGSYLIQQLKKEAYLAGRVPAARCDIGNRASAATLNKAGLKVAGCMLSGRVKAPRLEKSNH